MAVTVNGELVQIEELAASPSMDTHRINTEAGQHAVELDRANYYITQLNVPHWYTTDGSDVVADDGPTFVLPAGRHAFGPPRGAGATWTLKLLPIGAGSTTNRITTIRY